MLDLLSIYNLFLLVKFIMKLKKDSKKILTNEHGKIFQIKIPAKTVFSSDVREIIWNLIDNNTFFSLKWKYRIQLIIDELINNAIEHWSSWKDFININIKIFANSDIEVFVEDFWNWKSKIDAEELMRRTNENRNNMMTNPNFNKTIRWRGLSMIVLGWSDNFTYLNNEHWWLSAKMIKFFTPECANDTEKIVSKLTFPKAIKFTETTF